MLCIMPPVGKLEVDVGDGLSEFFGSEILAQSDYFGSMKNAGIFLGPKKNQRNLGCEKTTNGYFGVC